MSHEYRRVELVRADKLTDAVVDIIENRLFPTKGTQRLDDVQKVKFNNCRVGIINLAKKLVELAPPGEQRTRALGKLCRAWEDVRRYFVDGDYDTISQDPDPGAPPQESSTISPDPSPSNA